LGFREANTGIGTNIISGEEIAIKLESTKAKHPQLEYEARVYKVNPLDLKTKFRHLPAVLEFPLFAGSALSVITFVLFM
jgi:hypothetical protein